MAAVLSLKLDDFGLDELEAAATQAEVQINRNAARSQMANYIEAGWAERVAQGKFRFTEAGRNTFAEENSDALSKEVAISE